MARDDLSLGDWRFALCEADSASNPASATQLSFRPASVPGTVAQALIARGEWDWNAPPPLDEMDAWYRTPVSGHGAFRLECDGLATFAEIFLDDVCVGRSESMFVPASFDLSLSGDHILAIRFRALARELERRKGRARWRPRMIQPGALRFARTSALGHMPGFAPPAPPVGPWRGVRLVARDRARLVETTVRARLHDGDGSIELHLAFDRPPDHPPRAECEGTSLLLRAQTPTHFAGRLTIPRVDRWFPHTHGAPRLYEVAVHHGGETETIRTGFRAIDVRRDGGGFALGVNGVPVFCRGAVWTPLDPVSLQNDGRALSRQIELARLAGVNMFRVAGPFVYEDDSFHRACDEAGILVWQDFMFSNFDYPADDDFAALVEREARAFLQRTSRSPSLAVVCGGSEVHQQAAMLGLGEDKWRSPMFEDILPRIVARTREDVGYVANSPSGGAPPFHSDAGVAHYYGVGAYRRDLGDARRANVRFASECLGFANVPETRTLLEDFGGAPLSSPLWRPRIPRDQGAAQDFEDVRDHYVGLLYGVDPLALKRDDPQAYLDFSRAAVAETIEATIGEWRRAGSTNAGALIWFWKDLWASSGWGIVDWKGRPKSAWHAARRAFRPLQIVAVDEGVNGLRLHCINERPEPFEGVLELVCYKDGATVVMKGCRAISLAPRETAVVKDCEVWGAFFDTTWTYRFGPPSHEATRAVLKDGGGATVAESWHFPLGRKAALYSAGVRAAPFRDERGWGLRLSTDMVAQSVRIEDENATPVDNWLHLAPDEARVVRFLDADGPIAGQVAALGQPPFSYRAEE